MATVNELVTKFSFVGNLQPLDKFNANLGQSVKILAGFSVAIAGAGVGFRAWVNNITAGLDPMIQLSRETNVAIENIQALGFAASVSGSSATALERTISSLTKRIGDSARGMGASSQAFARLGINVRDVDGSLRSADDVLRDVGRSVRALNIPLAEQRSLLAQMGIDQSLIQMLNQTDEEMNGLIARAQRLGVITQEQADATASYNDSLTTMRYGLRAVQAQMAVGLAPELRKLSEGFITLLENNSEFISKGLQKTGEVLIEFGRAIFRLLPILALFGVAVAALTIKAVGLGVVMGLIFSPVILFTGAIALALLAVDDLIVAFKGGESVIAGFFANFGIDIHSLMQNMIDSFAFMVQAVIAVMTPILEFFRDTLNGVAKIFTGDFIGGIDQIATAFTDLGKVIVGAMTVAYNESIELFSSITDIVFDQFTNLGIAIGGIFRNLGSMIRESILSATTNLLPNWAINFLGLSSGGEVMPVGSPESVPVPNVNFAPVIPDNQPNASFAPQEAIEIGSGRVVNNSSSINQDVEINIQTADPIRAASAVEDSLQRQLETAQTQARRRGGR